MNTVTGKFLESWRRTQALVSTVENSKLAQAIDSESPRAVLGFLATEKGWKCTPRTNPIKPYSKIWGRLCIMQCNSQPSTVFAITATNVIAARTWKKVYGMNWNAEQDYRLSFFSLQVKNSKNGDVEEKWAIAYNCSWSILMNVFTFAWTITSHYLMENPDQKYWGAH